MHVRNFILIFATTLLLACTPGTAPNTRTAVTLGTQFYDAMKQGNIDQALDYYAEEFFAMRSREHWRTYLEDINKKVGALQSYKLAKLNADTRYRGKFFILEYRNIHEHGKTWETLTMVHQVKTNELRLIGHKITAKITAKGN